MVFAKEAGFSEYWIPAYINGKFSERKTCGRKNVYTVIPAALGEMWSKNLGGSTRRWATAVAFLLDRNSQISGKNKLRYS